VKIDLTRDEVAFCLKQRGRQLRGITDGGGEVVLEYLAELLRESLYAEMRKAADQEEAPSDFDWAKNAKATSV